MDPYGLYRQHPNQNTVTAQRGSESQSRPPIPSSEQGGLQSQQQLPSFKEILPPPLQTAIDSGSQYSFTADASANQTLQPSRSGGSALPSPNYSQSSSMPDSFDDFAPRTHEQIYQVPVAQRHPTSVNSNQQFPDMATSYGTYRPQYPPQQLGMRASPGLPPIRDIDQGFGKYGYDNGYMSGSNGFLPTYSQPMSGSTQYGNTHLGRRPSDVYESKPIGQTYPASNRPYPPIKSESQFPSHAPYDPYNPRGPYGYPHTQTELYSAGPIYPAGSEAGDSRNRRRRGNLPKQVTDILRAWFQDHLDHPYPTEEEKQMFIQQTGLTMNQISNWFINARRRHLPAMRQDRDRRAQGLDSEPQRHQR